MRDNKAPLNLNYKELGLKIGLEFHQQILAPYLGNKSDGEAKKNGSKLFCACPSIMREEEPDFTVRREIRAVSGESGKIDVAAKFEENKDQHIIYEGYNDSNCLIELDEEPIDPINQEALFRAVVIAKKIFGLEIFDEILTCRKTIIDGSNTSGFQRTLQIGYKGKKSEIEVDGKPIRIYQANLEEDSCRNTGKKGNIRKFRLDRLGIPLIEIATSPDMKTPEQVRSVASRIGSLLRTTGFVKRGLGTIRQDINVSIKRGTRIEIKGVVDLELLPAYVKNEAIRQVRMLEFIATLKERKLGIKEINSIKSLNVSKVFGNHKNKLISNSLKKGKKVIGAKIPKLKKLFAFELQPNYRVGTEISEICKVTSGVGGILHSDELDKFEISQAEINKINEILQIQESDGFILILCKEEEGNSAITGLKNAFNIWINSETLPAEVRAPLAGGTTGFLRPLPGAARMYPETDTISHFSKELMERVDKTVFELPEERRERYVKELNLPIELANQLNNHQYSNLFEKIVEKYKVSPVLVASTLLNTLVELRRRLTVGNIDKITEEHINEIFSLVETGKIRKSSIPEILEKIAETKEIISPNQIKDKIRIKTMDEKSVKDVINSVIEDNLADLEKTGMKMMGKIMGRVMAKIGNSAEGSLVNKLVKLEVQKRLK